MIELYFDTAKDKLPQMTDTCLPVLLFGKSALSGKYNSIGGAALIEFRRLQEKPDSLAFDFMMISLAVTAADTFVERDSRAEDAWCRNLKINLPVLNLSIWNAQKNLIKETLHFLSGDLWDIEFRQSNFEIPKMMIGSRSRKIFINNHESICLFSGGLDSTIGVLDLIKNGLKPVLVSHAYPKDRQKQDDVFHTLKLTNARFQVVANPRKVKEIPADVQMRTRSFNFIAFGALIGTALSKNHFSGKIVPLFVPENGLISINPPLTPRRIGTLSTRTTHPFFLDKLNNLFKNVGIPVQIENPYQFKTKGEMMLSCQDPVALKKVADITVSCGKWKRSGIQCGKCVPCLIRRASFHAASYKDGTEYKYPTLSNVIKNANQRDDLMSMVLAIRKIEHSLNSTLWVAKSGNLPIESTQRQKIIGTVLRGFKEVKIYLEQQSLGINI